MRCGTLRGSRSSRDELRAAKPRCARRERRVSVPLLLAGDFFGLGPLAVRTAHLEGVRPLLVTLAGEGVVEGDASHRAGELARPDQLVAFPARGAGGVPLAVAAGAGAHEALRALVVAPEPLH